MMEQSEKCYKNLTLIEVKEEFRSANPGDVAGVRTTYTGQEE